MPPSKEKNKFVEPTPTPRRASRRGLVLLGAILLALIGYNLGPKFVAQQLPGSYILCTPGGSKIYVVDEFNSEVQCISVDETTIVDVGSLGACFRIGPRHHAHILFKVTFKKGQSSVRRQTFFQFSIPSLAQP